MEGETKAIKEIGPVPMTLSRVVTAIGLIAIATAVTASVFPRKIELAALDGTDGFAINGIMAGDASGRVAGAGDVNGDGVDDLIIGALSADPNGRAGAGQSYVVFGSVQGFPAAVEAGELNGSNGFVINGIAAADQSGASVAGAGDINGDGFDDVIIGASGADPNGLEFAGQGYVVFGSAQGFPATVEAAALNGSNGFLVNGIAFGDQAGWSVAGAGDVNGDGVDDLIIGAPGADANGRSGAGQSYVVYGSTQGFPATVELAGLDGANGFAINGIYGHDDSGSSVAGAGDVNGDGLDDVIIGAPNAHAGTRYYAGQSYVVFGSAQGFPATVEAAELTGNNGFVINGIVGVDYSGWSVAGAGDVNGDGLDDLIVGAPLGDRTGATVVGQSYVVFGSDQGFPATVEAAGLNGTDGFVVNGIAPFGNSGRRVAGAGDVNGDGFDDLLIGAQYTYFHTGQSYVVFGSDQGFPATVEAIALNGRNGFLVNGIAFGDQAGASVAGAGDVNGDGLDDLVVGAPPADVDGRESAGQSYVVFGRRALIAVQIDIKPGRYPNWVNTKSNGKIPVAILSTAAFDASSVVDRGSLTFGRSGNEDSLHRHGGAIPNCWVEDVNSDALADLVCRFEIRKTGFQPGDTEGTLKGKTINEVPIKGRDSIQTAAPPTG